MTETLTTALEKEVYPRMTPDELNALLELLANALRGTQHVTAADVITPADSDGAPPELGVTINEVDLILVVEMV